MKKVENTEAFSKVERVHDDQVESLEYALVYKSIIYVTTLLAKSTHQQVISQQNTQSTACLPLQTCEKTIGQLLMNDTGGDFSVRNNFLT